MSAWGLPNNPPRSGNALTFSHTVRISATFSLEEFRTHSEERGPTLSHRGTPSLDWVGGRSYRSGLCPSSTRAVTRRFPVIRARLKGAVGFSCAARGLWATAARKRAM